MLEASNTEMRSHSPQGGERWVLGLRQVFAGGKEAKYKESLIGTKPIKNLSLSKQMVYGAHSPIKANKSFRIDVQSRSRPFDPNQ